MAVTASKHINLCDKNELTTIIRIGTYCAKSMQNVGQLIYIIYFNILIHMGDISTHDLCMCKNKYRKKHL